MRLPQSWQSLLLQMNPERERIIEHLIHVLQVEKTLDHTWVARWISSTHSRRYVIPDKYLSCSTYDVWHRIDVTISLFGHRWFWFWVPYSFMPSLAKCNPNHQLHVGWKHAKLMEYFINEAGKQECRNIYKKWSSSMRRNSKSPQIGNMLLLMVC